MPKLPLVRRISDMLKTTCPHESPLVRVLVHFVGHKLDNNNNNIMAGMAVFNVAGYLYIIEESRDRL